MAVSVYDDDVRYCQLEADYASFVLEQRREWQTIHVNRDLKDERRFHSGVAATLPPLPDDEKAALRAWLRATPSAFRRWRRTVKRRRSCSAGLKPSAR